MSHSKNFGLNKSVRQQKLADRMVNQYGALWSYEANLPAKNAKRKGWFKPWQT